MATPPGPAPSERKQIVPGGEGGSAHPLPSLRIASATGNEPPFRRSALRSSAASPPPLRRLGPARGEMEVSEHAAMTSEDTSSALHSVGSSQTSTPARSTPSPNALWKGYPAERTLSRSATQHHSYAAMVASCDSLVFEEGPSRAPTPGSPTSKGKAVDRPYRPGFQPKGLVRHRTDEFGRLRDSHRMAVELEEQRMERRLAKLVRIHSSAFVSTPAAVTPLAQVYGLFQSKQEAERQRVQQRQREAAQQVVKWQDDTTVSNCTLCGIRFSLAIRRHHCRLCGRVVCSSPQLPRLLQTDDGPRKPCSSLLLIDPTTSAIQPMPAYPALDVSAAEMQKYRDAEMRAIRFCHECQGVLLRISYGRLSTTATAFLHDYAALMQLQQDIEEALPEFHEMVLSLQKKDVESLGLQTHASQARKELLSRFARYDRLAKKIRALPPVVQDTVSTTQERLQQAIYTKAMVFLQKNMFPLQNLPNQDYKAPSETTASPAEPDAAENEQLRVLAEQESLLESYLAAAVKARNLDDVKALSANRDEIRAEIARVRSTTL